MRPISLSIAGLHSFREKQEIDFLSLYEAGVFGIFGPTGSGKSSILDAITLALYGKVERATNSTQGIMNHAEDEIQVSFTFELRNASGTHRYRIDRTFKRTGDITLKTTLCRLLHLTDEHIVLADKNNEVQQHIHDLLGLTIDDFTRAVILPQGKFAEFLSLKGTERRQMLQRLFHLEQYGDELNKKLRQRAANTETQLNGILREQQGLGDSSKEALELALSRVQESEQRVQFIEAERKKLEAEYEQKARIWQWQQELEKVNNELQVLQEQVSHIATLEKKLLLATEAQQLKPYVNEWESAIGQLQFWQEKSVETASLLEVAKAEEGLLAEGYQKAVHEKEEHQPFWIERLAQLKQAQEVQAEISKLQQELIEVTRQLEREKELEIEQLETLEKAKNLHQKAIQRQRELMKLLEEKSVSFEEREQVRKAYQESLQFINRQEQHHQLVKERSQKKETLQEYERKLENISNHKQSIHQLICTLLQQIADHYQHLHYQWNQLNQKQADVEAQQEGVQRSIEIEKEKNLAKHLAHQLRVGEACPVCGSLDHPSPIEDTDPNDLTLEKALLQIEKLSSVEQAGKKQLYVLQAELNRIESHFADLKDMLSEQIDFTPWENLFNQTREVATSKDFFSSENEQSLEELADDVIHLIHSSKDLLSSLTPLLDESKKLAREFREQQQTAAHFSIQVEGMMKELAEKEVKLLQAQEEIAKWQENWRSTYPKLDFDKMEEEQQRITNLDKEANEFRVGYEKSVQYIEEKEIELAKLQQELNQNYLVYAETKASFKQLQEQIEKKQEILHRLIGVQELEALILEASRRLEALKKQETDARERWNSTREKLQIVEKEQGVATESLKQAHSKVTQMTEQWKSLLAESLFSTMEEVKESFVPKEQILLWKNEIQGFREVELKWSQESARILGLLQGKALSSEEWQLCLNQREELELQQRDVLQERGAAKEAFIEIQQKHERYQSLEQERVDLSILADQLSKLQAVFRGNSFVEYLAEEQLMLVCRDASQRLGTLTRQRYALEVDSSGGFVIRDDANGGVKRPVSTLSGGEIFLTSLALALALSAQIQLKGEYPLEFFFLDEGFGTLDPDLLDTVVTALENLHTTQLAVGVISHVPELRARLARKLIVEPAEPSGRGSRVYFEAL